jgi:transketolase
MALMRALPNLSVVAPADEDECRQVLEYAATHETGPMYIRLGTAENAKVRGFEPNYRFGWAKILSEGSDLGLLSTGTMLAQCTEAVRALQTEGIAARLIHCSTVKPLPEELLVSTARITGAIVTAEEHSIIGGFGSAVAELLGRSAPVPLEMIGVRDSFGESGTTAELMEKFGLTTQAIVEAARRALGRKKAAD